MKKEQLEQKLQNFYGQTKPLNPKIHKEALREESLQYFRSQKVEKNTFWGKLLSKQFSMVSGGVLAVFLISTIIPVFQGGSNAGRLSPSGLVEIVRDGETMLAKNTIRLKAGDEIRVGNNGQAEISSKNFHSIAGDDTVLKVEKDGIYLSRGTVDHEFKNTAQLQTDRGTISGETDAQFRVVVTDSGEAQITPQKNTIRVSDTQGEIILSTGEKLNLSTDTELVFQGARQVTALNQEHKKAIRLKLDIARTKALSGVIERENGDKTKAESDMASAKRTFVSILQVPKEGKARLNTELFAIKDVYQNILTLTDDKLLLREISSLEALLSSIDLSRRYALSDFTGIDAYDRYVLVENIVFDITLDAEKNTLQREYAKVFARQIQWAGDEQEQIHMMTQSLALMPRDDLSREFLKEVLVLMPGDLAKELRERIINW